MAVQAPIKSDGGKKKKSSKDSSSTFKAPLPPQENDSSKSKKKSKLTDDGKKEKVKKVSKSDKDATSKNKENKEVEEGLPTTNKGAKQIADEKETKETTLVKLSDEQMDAGVKAFGKLLELHSNDKADLFKDASEEGKVVRLQVSGIKLPRDSEQQILKFRLPHPHTPETRDICLIVKDMEKGIRPDHEETVRHYEALLAEKGVKGVTKVMALRELKVEYKTYESKTALCHMYDHFFADARIIRFVPKFLGKAFYKRRKFPVQVNMLAPNLAAEITRAVHTVCFPLKYQGSCSTVTLGLSVAPAQHLLDNLGTVVRAIETKYPGGWLNVRALHLLSGTCSLPLYMTLRGTHEVGMVSGRKRKRKGLVVDELSTVVGATVTVTPTGSVRVKRTKDPMWPEDDGEEAKEVTNEVAETEADAEKPEEKSKEKKPKKKKAKKPEDDDSDDDMENEEMAYMQKVADEEEEIEKALEATEDQLGEQLKNTKSKEVEDESEEDEDADDAAEAENLLSDGEDSDSEDELLMKNAGVEEDEEEEEEAPPAKKSKKGEKKAKAKSKEKVKEKPATKKAKKQKKFIEQKKKAKLGKVKK